MASDQHVKLIDQLRAEPAETEWLEFKRTRCQHKEMGEYLSALANSASLAQQPRGYLALGIDDATHGVVGTSFDPARAKQGNQDLRMWLAARLHPRTHFECHTVDHLQGKVVLLEVWPARREPVSFAGTEYVRVGSHKTELRKHPERARAIWMQESDWSAEVCEGASLEDLEPEAIVQARGKFAEQHPDQAGEVAGWDDRTFLNKAMVLRQGEVTNAAIVLLGRPESATLLSPAVAKVSWMLKDGDNDDLDYAHIGPPFLRASDQLLEHIRNLTIRELPHGTLFPVVMPQYDTWVVREALHNAIAHQDYQLGGRIVVVESPDQLLFKNMGYFLASDVEAIIRLDAPQPVYRNRLLAEAMMRLGLIDTQGGGIRRMFRTQQERSLPLPGYSLEVPEEVTVVLPGKVLDVQYTRLLMARTDLSLEQVLLLDKVQKGREIGYNEYRNLKRRGLVLGRYPDVVVTNSVGLPARRRGRGPGPGRDTQYYLETLLELVRVRQPVTPAEAEEALLPELPDWLTPEQKHRKVRNLMQQLRRDGEVENRGSRRNPLWYCTGDEQG